MALCAKGRWPLLLSLDSHIFQSLKVQAREQGNAKRTQDSSFSWAKGSAPGGGTELGEHSCPALYGQRLDTTHAVKKDLGLQVADKGGLGDLGSFCQVSQVFPPIVPSRVSAGRSKARDLFLDILCIILNITPSPKWNIFFLGIKTHGKVLNSKCFLPENGSVFGQTLSSFALKVFCLLGHTIIMTITKPQIKMFSFLTFALDAVRMQTVF